MTADESEPKPLTPLQGVTWGGVGGGLLGMCVAANFPISGKTLLKITAASTALGAVVMGLVGVSDSKRYRNGTWTDRERARQLDATAGENGVDL